jgi:16S rRNA (cytosine1407-C5)-methyltransferase
MTRLPEKFLERLRAIVPEDQLGEVLGYFERRAMLVWRVNTLKINSEEALFRLKGEGVVCWPLQGIKDAYVCPCEEKERIMKSPLLSEGSIFIQSASSMLASAVLNPGPQQFVLDMCSAPGGKTSHLAALMGNEGKIIALEAVKPRFFKLKSVLGLLGVSNVQAKLLDARRYRPKDMAFDKVLVDAPCSSEGRFRVDEPASCAYWSERKIKEMKHKQKGLLLRGLELLRPGGELVYSTCTFAPEENEEVVHWALAKKKGEAALAEIPLERIDRYPALQRWGKREFDATVSRCVRVLPRGPWDAFFMAKFIRL